MSKSLYNINDINYFEHGRIELLNLIPNINRNGAILEVGAASGKTLLYAKKNGFAKDIYGIELFKIDNSDQVSKEFEEFIIGNIEDMDLKFEEKLFDVILFPDVLEHLVDPTKVILNMKKFLKDDGVIIASIPNIRNWRVLYDIALKGDFKYANEGILDRTHLRFFTKKNIISLFVENTFNVISIVGNIEVIKSKSKIINKITFGLFNEFLSVQYFIVVKK